MFFGGLFKKKKKEISKEMFGARVLSRFILKSGERYSTLIEELGRIQSPGTYVCYLHALLFLSQRILSRKYSASDVTIITEAAINGIIDNMATIAPSKKAEAKSMFREQYEEYISCLDLYCDGIHDEKTYHGMTECFLEDCAVKNTTQNHLLVFTEFSLFVTYHADDILNEEIVLV